MEHTIRKWLPSAALAVFIISGCNPPIIMGPSIALKGQSNTQLKRDEADCKLAAEIDEKKNPEKYKYYTYTKGPKSPFKSNYAFLPSKHFQACMIARGYKTEVDVSFYRAGVGGGFFNYDVNTKRDKTQDSVWNDLLDCHKAITETELTGVEVGGALLISPIISGILLNKIVERTFVPCITDREYIVVETKDIPDEDDREETPVASAIQPQPEITPSSSEEASPAPSEVTSTPPEVTPISPEVSPAASKLAPTPSAEQLSIEDRLRRLKNLHGKNLITDEEYEKAKKDVLKKLTE